MTSPWNDEVTGLGQSAVEPSCGISKVRHVVLTGEHQGGDGELGEHLRIRVHGVRRLGGGPSH